MTYEEALNEINQECVICRTSNNCAKDECIWYICKKAIDKQIPKKPREYELANAAFYKGCPSCGAILNNNHYFLRICHCGQKLEV